MISVDRYIQEHQNTPFKWGEHDCCLFVADWILEKTGNDLAIKYRGKYSTKQGAFKLLFKLGLNDIKTLFKQSLNNQISIAYAKRGDVALVNYNDEIVGGIVGVNCVYCVSHDGIVKLPLDNVDCAFSAVAS